MKTLFVFFFFFLLLIGTALAITQGAYSTIRFVSQVTTCEGIESFELCLSYGCYIYDNSCHTNPQEIVYCNEIVNFDKYTLCVTPEGRLTLVIRE